MDINTFFGMRWPLFVFFFMNIIIFKNYFVRSLVFVYNQAAALRLQNRNDCNLLQNLSIASDCKWLQTAVAHILWTPTLHSCCLHYFFLFCFLRLRVNLDLVKLRCYIRLSKVRGVNLGPVERVMSRRWGWVKQRNFMTLLFHLAVFSNCIIMSLVCAIAIFPA